MKPTPIFVAAAGFAMIGACSVKTEDNAAENADTNAAAATQSGESAGTASENAAGTDTLGNQLNQLNESDAATANETENVTTNSAQ
jgi:hypothetical protein